MIPKISKITTLKNNCSTAVIINDSEQFSQFILSELEREYLEKKLENENEAIIYKHPDILFFYRKKEDMKVITK